MWWCALCGRAGTIRGVRQVHEGHPHARVMHGCVVVLCDLGHVLDAYTLREWAGSMMEARCANPTYRVSCQGTAPLPTSST